MKAAMFAFALALTLGYAMGADADDEDTEDAEEPTPFVNEPAWDDDSGNVIFMVDEHFEDWKEENPQFMAFFYAPWCGHCKNAKPFYGAASKKISIPMVAMDCTSTGKDTCESNDVSGFPTIKFFDGEEEPAKYEGARTEAGFVGFLKKKDPNYDPGEFVNEVPVEWEENGRVIHMTDDHFEGFREKKKQFLAMFYAPWCGHCKEAKPDYAESSAKFRRSMPFLAMDCTASGAETCGKFDVKSYPTFKFFEQGKEPEDCPADMRQSGDFISFVEKKLDAVAAGEDGEIDLKKLRVKALRKMLRERGVKCLGCTEKSHFVDRVKETMHLKKKVAKGSGMTLMQERRLKEQKAACEKGWDGEGHGDDKDVVHLSDYNFDEYLKAHPEGFLAMFYAPWCGHCKEAKPWAVEAATNTAKWGAPGRMVVVDAEMAPELKTKYNIDGFPEYHWFEEGELADGYYEQSGAPRGNVGWEKMIMKKHDPEWVKPEAGPFVNEPAWDDDSGEVVFMDDDHWDKYRKENPKFLAFFYAPWCGHCKAAKPHYGKASQSDDVEVPMLAMDCTTAGASTCSEFGVNSYPTLKWFDGPDSPTDYDGSRDESGFIEFIVEHQDPDYVKPPAGPFENEPQWGDDSHDVVFMDDAHFDEWKEENPTFFAFFYAPWCGHCKAAKPDFGEASIELETPLVAMDCTGSGKKTCSTYDVGGFPTIKMFKDGEDFEKFTGPRNKAGFIRYVEDRTAEEEEVEISKDEL